MSVVRLSVDRGAFSGGVAEPTGGLRARRGPRLLGADRLEVTLPSTEHALEALSIQAIVTAASFAVDLDEPRHLQDLEVARRRGPAVLKACCEVAGGELAAEMTEKEQHVASRGMGQGGEDDVEVLEGGR
jgi:hypothetical protein